MPIDKNFLVVGSQLLMVLFQVSEHLPMQCLKHHNALMRVVA
jgi:hypothetical protein